MANRTALHRRKKQCAMLFLAAMILLSACASNQTNACTNSIEVMLQPGDAIIIGQIRSEVGAPPFGFDVGHTNGFDVELQKIIKSSANQLKPSFRVFEKVLSADVLGSFPHERMNYVMQLRPTAGEIAKFAPFELLSFCAAAGPDGRQQ